MGSPADIDGPDLNFPDLGSWIGESGPIVEEDVEDSPRDEPLLVDDYGVTEYEQAHPEPLADRLRREERDIPVNHRPIDPGLRDAAGFPGRIVADEDGATIALGDEGGFSAEEAALHLESQPLTSSSD